MTQNKIETSRDLDKECIDQLCGLIKTAPFAYVYGYQGIYDMALIGEFWISISAKQVYMLRKDGKHKILLYQIPEKYIPTLIAALDARAERIKKRTPAEKAALQGVCDDHHKRLKSEREFFSNILPKNPALTTLKLLNARQK
ncbi:MAG: hypothetical protein K2M34_02190 [Alphaproteobacteria bacterium]|nr:hypothetical protein [Alphaproteobacteria bacterium]